MRIIAGQYKGRILQTPPGLTSRPTLSRIRESLFNILMPVLPGSDFLDLYAGAGSIGLEAASRGCRSVVLVEMDRVVFRVLEANVSCLRTDLQRIEAVRGDVSDEVERMISGRKRFDIVFLDPPYIQQEIDQWQNGDKLSRLLNLEGVLILQHAKSADVPQSWAGCVLQKTRFYGKTGLSFYKEGSAKEA